MRILNIVLIEKMSLKVILLACINILFCYGFWALIYFWVIIHDGHIRKNVNVMTTNVLKMKSGPFQTNYSYDKFQQHVKYEELVNYNRIWDVDDYSIIYPNEVHVITNLVITSNQTVSKCPGFRYESCNPIQPDCVKGHATLSGIKTGQCIPSHFGKDLWSCEIQGLIRE